MTARDWRPACVGFMTGGTFGATSNLGAALAAGALGVLLVLVGRPA